MATPENNPDSCPSARRRRRFPGAEFQALLGSALSADHARQTTAEAYIPHLAGGGRPAQPPRVLDVGCGDGNSVDHFRAQSGQVDWHGIDLPGAPSPFHRTDADFTLFDGHHIPFPTGWFDAIYCKQVLEHVAHPEQLLREMHRVVKPGGLVAGSTSHLEPYHAFSVWNYTPVGLVAIFRGAGLEVLELRPGIDAFTLIIRRLSGRSPWFNRWWARESPFNRFLDLVGRLARFQPTEVNAAKLLFCGQFAFLAVRDNAEAA